MSWAQRRREAREEGLRKHAERFEASANFDKAIYVWENIGDLEEVARVRELKAEYNAATGHSPRQSKQSMQLTLLAMTFLGITVVLFFAREWLGTSIPCCSSFILFMIFTMWLSEVDRAEKAVTASVIAKIRSQREAFEEEKLREQNARERAQERRQRRKAMRQEANERERALDYNSAIRIWEELGQIKEAARVRKLKARQSAIKVEQTVIHGDYVDDRDTTYIDDRDTIVKDSVISKSSIGAGGDDKLTKIKELRELHDAGAIDTAEFQQMKKEILGK